MGHIKPFIIPLNKHFRFQMIQFKKIETIPISLLIGRHQMSPLCFDLFLDRSSRNHVLSRGIARGDISTRIYIGRYFFFLKWLLSVLSHDPLQSIFFPSFSPFFFIYAYSLTSLRYCRILQMGCRYHECGLRVLSAQ